jgi:hypothetical protein
MGQTFQVEPTTSSRNEGDTTERKMVAGYMTELDLRRSSNTDLPNIDPSDVLARISGIAGRLAEIRAQLYRLNTQRCTALRTREVDPLREDLDLQFRIHSRRIALLEWELKLSGGAP